MASYDIRFQAWHRFRVLKMSSAGFHEVPEGGLTVMSNLECLHMRDSYVGADLLTDVRDIRTHSCHISFHMSSLTESSELRFDVTNILGQTVSFDWVAHLINLCSLSIGFCQISGYVFVGS